MMQIKNWQTGAVIFEGNYPSIKAGVSLAFADLTQANFFKANITNEIVTETILEKKL